MKAYLLNLYKKIQDYWVENFIKYPDKLSALKITVCIGIVLIPTKLLGDAFIATVLALGIVATSLAETDVHPRGRLKSLMASLIVLPTISLCVELTIHYPLVFLVFLGISTFSLTILGGKNARYQGVTFGGVLIATYTMLGVSAGKPFYYQPLFFFIGGMFYSAVSLYLLSRKPWRILQEQLAFGYEKLSQYIAVKAQLFPSLPSQQESVRNELALLNIEVFQQIEQVKKDLYSFTKESSEKSLQKIDKYYQKWYTLQALHERAISSHEQYDVLSKKVQNKKLITGLGQLMKELSGAIHLYAQSLLSNSAYQHPISLEWTVKAMAELFEKNKQDTKYRPLSLLFRNLKKMAEILSSANTEEIREELRAVNQKITTEKVSLKELLSPQNLRFRFAVRLTLCLIAGYLTIHYFAIEKGAWVLLTSLIVCQQTYNATRQRIFKRILGTFLGVIFGVIVAKLIPTLEGQIIVLLICIYCFNYWVKSNYILAVVFITIFVLEAFNIQSNKGILVLGPRLIDTLIGASFAFLSVRLLWPDWQYKQLDSYLKAAIKYNKRYFESVYKKGISANEYLHNQRSAHRSDNNLTNVWKGMKIEPKSKQKLITNARNLTYYNHSLISYISAFGIHKNRIQITPDEVAYCEKVSQSLNNIINLWENQNASFDVQIQENEALVETLRKLKDDSGEHKNYNFIFNVANVSKELFLETLDLIKNRTQVERNAAGASRNKKP